MSTVLHEYSVALVKCYRRTEAANSVHLRPLYNVHCILGYHSALILLIRTVAEYIVHVIQVHIII